MPNRQLYDRIERLKTNVACNYMSSNTSKSCKNIEENHNLTTEAGARTNRIRRA